MKIPSPPHRWSVTPSEAIAIQSRLAASVRQVEPRGRIRLVAGADVAFSHDGRRCIAGVVVWDRHDRRAIERRTTGVDLTFPYVPGLLSFREAPAILAALRQLRTAPDALMLDGQGLAHPRRFGLACHVGVLTSRPTIGCAKSRLVGEHRDPARRRGSCAPLILEGEVVGTVLRTRDGVRPVYVSVGHRISLEAAVELTFDCTAGYRLPEPTRLADHLVTAARRQRR
jgi:deoxyribonuclease V